MTGDQPAPAVHLVDADGRDLGNARVTANLVAVDPAAVASVRIVYPSGRVVVYGGPTAADLPGPPSTDGIRPHRYPRTADEADRMRRMAEQTPPYSGPIP